MSDYISNPEETKELLPRFRLFYGVLTFTFLVFLMRLWYLQIIEGTELREFSEKNRIKQSKISAPRGLVFDRDGKVLVENHPGFDVVLSPQYIQNLDEVAAALSPIIKIDADKIIQRVQKSRRQNGPFAGVKIKDNLSKEEVFRLKRIRLDIPGLDIRESVVRYYPLQMNGAQLFGYVAEISKAQIPRYNEIYKGFQIFEQGDVIGKNGLEEVLEKDIRGKDGISYIQVDAFGRETQTTTPNIYGEQIKDQDPSSGNSVVLTLDKSLQEVAYNTFIQQQRIGGVVAMKSNGEILAWISTPSFNPNEFSVGISPQTWSSYINDPFKPLRNKVIQDYFSPGSTFKAFVALAALEDGAIKANTIVNCPGLLRFGRRDYHDSVRGGHGNITIYEAIERSSNVFFFKLGITLGIDKMYDYISQFGIGQKSGVDIPREALGLMPNSTWKKANMGEEWQPGENLSTAIGQAFVQTTPLQLAVAYNAIGLEGKVVKPFVIQKIIDNQGQVIKNFSPQVVRDLQNPAEAKAKISAENFKIVKEALRRVVQGSRGTAKHVNIPGADIAGKTGTTQVMGFSADQIYQLCEKRPIQMRHHGWFVAFAPADKPEITVAALAEHSCHGSSGAGPVVKAIMKAYFEKYHPGQIEEYLKKTKIIKVDSINNEPTPEGE